MINGEIIVDNFAGGGGASTGMEIATGVSPDIAINHDPMAIAQHKANHPNAKHYCESVWEVDPVEACAGRPVALAWFSPDCKHFSKAKGAKPKDKNIRGLAWVVCRWAGTVRPRVIMLENVEEFKSWGPLNRNHRPIKAKQGTTFRRFVHQLEKMGYTVEFQELIAADFGAPTMRKRFFMIARCDGRVISWPHPTHGPAGSDSVKEGRLLPYVGAYTQLDFTLPCPSIFDSSAEIKKKYGLRAVRPLAPKTMERIARGIKKFVLDNPEPFIIECNHGGERKPQDIHSPMPTITGKHGFGVVAPTLIQYHSETAPGETRGQGIKQPIMTVDGSNRYGMVSTFLKAYFTEENIVKTKVPKKTMVKTDDSMVASSLLQMNNHCDGKDLTKPIPTITAGDGHFGEVRAFLIKYYGQGTGQEIKAPLDTITAQDRFGLITIEGVDYQIIDIGLRMLEPKELYGCQGFPGDYIIDRDYTGKPYPRAEQVKRCGNAVCPPIPAALVCVNLPELCKIPRLPICRPDRMLEEESGQLKFA